MKPAVRAGEILAAAGGVALLVVMFLPWYGASLGGIADVTASAWQAFSVVDVLLLLVAVAGIVVLVAAATQDSPAMPVAANVIAAGLAFLVALVLLYRLVNQPGANDAVSVRVGAYLGLLSVLAVLGGAWLAMRDERTDGFPAPDVPAQPAPPATAAAGSDVARGVAPDAAS